MTALRVAISETPRRTGIGKSLTAAVAHTIQHSVGAVRSFDTAIGAVVALLTEKATPAPSGLPNRLAAEPAATPLRAVREPAGTERPATARRGRNAGVEPVADPSAPVHGRPTTLPSRSTSYNTGSMPVVPPAASYDTGSMPVVPPERPPTTPARCRDARR